MATQTKSKSRLPHFLQSCDRIFASPRFFWVMIGLFALQAAWIALTARYPQAFDEHYHLGIIRMYSHQLSPFMGPQPYSSDIFGAVFRDPSYLYHYLMSFPYRVITTFTNSEATLVILLRLANIGMFIVGLAGYRRLLQYCKVSPRITNLSLLALAFTPVMPLLAAQINYDNAMFAASGWFLLVSLQTLSRIRTERQLPWTWVMATLTAGILISLIKYAFLPVFAVVFIMLAIRLWRRFKAGAKLVFKGSFHRPVSWLLLIGLLISFGLFFQRYGVNVIQYHTPVPECDQVIGADRCQVYAPWQRNYAYNKADIQLYANNYATFPWVWLHHIMGEMVFTITSRWNAIGTVDYFRNDQLIVPYVLAFSILIAAGLALLRYGRWLWSLQPFRVLLIIMLVYTAILFGQNYSEFINLGVPVAIHGRYLLPVLPIAYVAAALLLSRALELRWLERAGGRLLKPGLVMIIGLLFLIQGGGFVTWIYRSNADWAWPQSQSAQQANQALENLLTPIVIDIPKHDH